MDTDRFTVKDGWTVAYMVALALALAVTSVLVVVAMGGDSGRQSDEPGEAPVPPAALPLLGSYITSEVRADGTIRVTQWIRSWATFSSLTLSAYDAPLPPGEPVAKDLRAVDDGGRVLVAGAVVGTESRRLEFARPTRFLELTYELQGAVDRSGTVPGRALAAITFLDVDYASAGGSTTVLVTGGSVLNLACAPATAAPSESRPCGAPEGQGWRVTLSADDREDRVTAQLDLG
jgi:hypothetical protein